jgi:3-hydroxyisobutyrate dehydrogenase
MADVALLGTGRMGSAMARKLVEAGHHVIVWNRTTSGADALAAEVGSDVALTASDAVASASLVISMLADGPATSAVLLDPLVLSALKPGTIVCDMATSGVDTARALDEGVTSAGARFVDAPVSGSVPTIMAGQLLVMASGDRSGVDEAEPILSSFAKKVAYLGDAGAGQAMKLAVNLVVFTLNSAVSEALTLATSAGVEPEAVYDIFQDSVIAAPFVNYKRPAFLDPSTPVAMSLALTRKDMNLITAFAAVQGVPAEVAGAVRDEVSKACDAGFAEQDMAGLARFLKVESKGQR